MKKKLYEFAKKHIKAENVKIAILFIPLMIIIINEINEGTFQLKEFSDTTILVSFLLIFLCENIAMGVLRWVTKVTEDDVKLETDYKSLVDRYSVEKENMISTENEKIIHVPVISLVERSISSEPFKFNIQIDEKNKKYILPKQIADNSEKIFRAHANSAVYNNVNIRLNDLLSEDNELTLIYSYTTYFDSLLTNRAMDYSFNNGRTVREIYEPGPYISNLSDSRLSNHLGFNGFVELSDGYVIFLKREKKLSIAKGLWQQSIGASLKTKYCVDCKHSFTTRGLSKAIQMEIEDELKISIKEEEHLENSIFAFYRDLVEGGKPQFLFYYKTDLYNKETFEEHFVSTMKSKKEQNKKKSVIDGSEFAFFKIEDLKTFRFTENSMITKDNKVYRMMPSSIASIILLLNNFDFSENN